MSEVQPRVERITLEDVAREAGVSLATVDRVINRRPGVREKTVARVEAAISRLSYRPDPVAARLARNRTFRFCFVLPRGSNTFMGLLEEQVRHTADWLAAQRAYTDVVHVDVFDPEALARTLDELGGRYDGVATIALDHPRVRAAIDELTARGVAVVTLVSDAPTSRRIHYAGIDNTAAGRTAGTLMGRFLAGRRGRVGVIAGSLALRDHAERHFGFAQVIGTEYPDLTVMPVREGRDDREQTMAITGPSSPKRPIWWASTASARATGASGRRWRNPAAPGRSSSSGTTSRPLRGVFSCGASWTPSSTRMRATRRARPPAC